jgi:hypothetical protein
LLRSDVAILLVDGQKLLDNAGEEERYLKSLLWAVGPRGLCQNMGHSAASGRRRHPYGDSAQLGSTPGYHGYIRTSVLSSTFGRRGEAPLGPAPVDTLLLEPHSFAQGISNQVGKELLLRSRQARKR